jgi:DNA-binding MltR family transcriptional regulator
MANRDALRKLSRRFPAPREIEKITEALRQGTDLHVAIVGSALVEAHLEKLLIHSFDSKSSELIGQIFQNRGPLSDFNSKIMIAHAYGVVVPATAAELHSIRAIRNTFAHSKVEVTFANEHVAREVETLHTLKLISKELPKENWDKTDSKSKFVTSVRIMLVVLDSLTEKLISGEHVHSPLRSGLGVPARTARTSPAATQKP